jgi:PAS domain S-box-containing protein
LWKIPAAIAEDPDDAAQVRHVMNAVKAPAAFLEKIKNYYAHPDESGQDEVELKDGTILDRITAPVLGKDGKNYGRIWTFRDVTQSRQAEAALRETQALYYSLVDQLPAGIFRKDAAGRFVFVNAWFCRLKQMDAEQILGKTSLALANLEMARFAGQPHLAAHSTRRGVIGESHHQAIMRTGQPVEMEEEYHDANGSSRYMRVVKSAVFDADGKIIGSQAVLFDVTALKLAEAELAYERDLLQTFLDTSPDSIFFKDLQSRFVKASRSVVEYMRKIALRNHRNTHPGDGTDHLPAHLISHEQFHKYIIGKTDADIYSAESATAFSQDEQEIIRTGQPKIGQIEQIIQDDGTKIWHMTTKVPWRNKVGQIIGTYGTARDITDLKNAEAKIEAAHRQLLETSRLAGMAEVATNVLHNVGNVLNSVNVSATLVLNSMRASKVPYLGKVVALLNKHAADPGAFLNNDPQGRQLPGYLNQLSGHLAHEQQVAIAELELLRKNIEHINDIVAMQQSYAKISGVTETVMVSELVEDALRMNAGALARHEVELVRDFADVPPITVEKHKVLQILVNLIRNAKYACDDSRRKDKQLRLQISKIGVWIRIAVIDNGIGIPPENLTRIFNHGFTTRKGGHGFGLHSGALAAQELGGSLTARSEGAGRGAIFNLELPLQPPKVDL